MSEWQELNLKDEKIIQKIGEKYKKDKINLNNTAKKIIEKRYLKKDQTGVLSETPEDMFWRIAYNIASADLIYDPWANVEDKALQFYQMMTNFEFLPNSPTLMNAGRELQQLSACFVLPVEDSMDSIFEAVKSTALIHKSGGGTGFSFSSLRPKNDRVASTGGVASGPLSFMQVFNAATDVVKQGGTRRGANMAILNVDHPDILEFITAKRELKQLNNFNLSVGITEEFMQKVINGEDYSLINPNTKQAVDKLNAREVFDLIVEMAWQNGEPGIIFIDRLNKTNPTPQLGDIESTNPCGEQPLLPFEACNLGSINLSKMIKESQGKYFIDYEKLEKTIRLGVKFLDNVIDVNKYPLPKIAQMTKANRKIGLGVMGFADLLILLEIPYNSPEALKKAEGIMCFIQKTARDESKEIAKERGVFPNFKGSIYENMDLRMRNATLTTIAPTGTLSIIANCSSGIEPLFAICFVRQILGGEKFIEIHPLFKKIAQKYNLISSSLMEKIAEEGTLQVIEEIPENFKKIFVCAHDIIPEWHIKMQAAFQKYTDNAVSKTVNFKEESTREEVKDVFLLAYRENCKGVTIYRHGSRQKQVLNVGNGEKKEIHKEEKNIKLTLEQTSKKEENNSHILKSSFFPNKAFLGITERIPICNNNLYITVNYDDSKISEVLIKTKSKEGCNIQLEILGRLINLAIKEGIEVNLILRELRDIKCPDCPEDPKIPIVPCTDGIIKVLERALNKKESFIHLTSASQKNSVLKSKISAFCPECKGVVEYTEGCTLCRNCGYSKCG